MSQQWCIFRLPIGSSLSAVKPVVAVDDNWRWKMRRGKSKITASSCHRCTLLLVALLIIPLVTTMHCNGCLCFCCCEITIRSAAALPPFLCSSLISFHIFLNKSFRLGITSLSLCIDSPSNVLFHTGFYKESGCSRAL